MDHAVQIKLFEAVLDAFHRGDIEGARGLLNGKPAELTKQMWLAVSANMAANNDYVKQLSAREHAFAGKELTRAESIKFADMHIALGNYDRAKAYVDALLEKYPNDPEGAMIGADIHRWRGEIDQARDMLVLANRSHPNNPQIMQGLLDISKNEDPVLLINAKKYVDAELGEMTGRRRLAFTLARLSDQAGEYDEAFRYASLANSLYQEKAVSDIHKFETHLKRAVALYEATPPSSVNTDAKMLYVVGPPRSGGSLLQSIISADPKVTSVGERGALMGWILPILDQCPQLNEALYNWNSVATDLPVSDIAGMRGASKAGKIASVFVDKAPHHAHVAGLLHRLHPSAQFIDVRRDPFDVAISIFFRDFSDRYDHTRSLSMIAGYLRFQRVAITAWENVGVPVIRHNHSRFLNDPLSLRMSLFDKLGLVWNDSYLLPENRKSLVPTFSSVQVRNSVTKAYSGKGQHYKKFMDAETLERLEKLLS